MSKKSNHVGYRFAVLYRLTTFFNSCEVRQMGLTSSQVPFLAELFHEGKAVTQDRLSCELEIDKAATARNLELLEKKGLVERKVNPENRRQKMVCATPAAWKLKNRFFKILKNTGEKFLTDFSEKEKESLLHQLDRMIDNAREKKYGPK